MVIQLNADAKYGYGGKQYIARITGRNPKWTFERQFVGTKGGKRRESSTYLTDEPGLYVTCDIDRKGNKDETYWLVKDKGDGELKLTTCTKEQAMKLARYLDEGLTFPDAVLKIWPKKESDTTEIFDPCL